MHFHVHMGTCQRKKIAWVKNAAYAVQTQEMKFCNISVCFFESEFAHACPKKTDSWYQEEGGGATPLLDPLMDLLDVIMGARRTFLCCCCCLGSHQGGPAPDGPQRPEGDWLKHEENFPEDSRWSRSCRQTWLDETRQETERETQRHHCKCSVLFSAGKELKRIDQNAIQWGSEYLNNGTIGIPN